MSKRESSVSEADAWKLYLLLEEMNGFLHQPANYRSSDNVQQWLNSGAYEKLSDAYYRIVAAWFPVDDDTGQVVGPGGVLHPPAIGVPTNQLHSGAPQAKPGGGEDE